MPSPVPFTPPAGYSDYYILEYQINYNNSLVNSLVGLGYASPPPQERQAGWNEAIYLNTPVTAAVPLTAAYNLLAARCGILGVNFYIKKALIHWNSVFKSSFPLPNSATQGLWDAQTRGAVSVGTVNPPQQYCNTPEETILLRCECSDFRRYEHSLRGIKDYMSDDCINFISPSSYATTGGGGTTGMFDAAPQAIPMPNSTGGRASTWTVTNTNGGITNPVLVNGGLYPGVAAGVYPCFFNGQNGQATRAFGSITINGAGVATSAVVYPNYNGTGYSGVNVNVGLSNDPYGLPNYQPTAAYWANFMSCLIAYTGSGTIRRVSQTTYSGNVKPSFPSGIVPVILGTQLDACTRVMFQRMGNRQTGQIRLTKPARRTIAR